MGLLGTLNNSFQLAHGCQYDVMIEYGLCVACCGLPQNIRFEIYIYQDYILDAFPSVSFHMW